MLFSLLLSLLVTMFLPYVAKIPLAYAMQKSGRYDNNNPRQQQAALKGFGQRANAAHYNSFEALAIFAAAVLITAMSSPSVGSISVTLAWMFVASRIGYLFCYWYNLATLRSLIWFLGMVCCFAMAMISLIF